MRIQKVAPKKDTRWGPFGEECILICPLPFILCFSLTYWYYDFNGIRLFPQESGFIPRRIYIIRKHTEANNEDNELSCNIRTFKFIINENGQYQLQ